MKKVSFEVAMALKKTGYPQGNTDKCYLTADHNQYYKKGQIIHNEDGSWTTLTSDLADIPTYLDVWLWLEQEKDICIEVKDNHYYITTKVKNKRFNGDTIEEAIIAGIEYLVENDLIK